MLVVDIDVQSTQFVRELLHLYNYEVMAAFDSDEALRLVGEFTFDSLIISLDMPGGGFELSQRLVASAGHEDTPMVFVTDEWYDNAMLMEANFYGGLFLHRKPYSEPHLLSQISTMVRIKLLQDELKERMAELDRLASTDTLTGLYNRRMFFRRLDEEIARANRAVSPITLVYIDIDHFKKINDSHGHAAGDAVLQQAARAMQRILRRADILGRLGGEEFMIILPETQGGAGRQIAERLRKQLSQTKITYGELELYVTISIGVFYLAEPGALSIDEMVKVADEAMYEAKETGRNKVVYRGSDELQTPQAG